MWDTVEFLEQEEPPRPEYEAKCKYERRNPVTGVTRTHIDSSFYYVIVAASKVSL